MHLHHDGPVVPHLDHGDQYRAVLPHTWVQGDKVFWTPYPPKDSVKVRAAIRRRDQPGEGWQTFEPVRLLISRDQIHCTKQTLSKMTLLDIGMPQHPKFCFQAPSTLHTQIPNQTLHSPANYESTPQLQPFTHPNEIQAPFLHQIPPLTPQPPPNPFQGLSSEDVALQKLISTVTELAKEVKDLRKEVQEFRQSCRCCQPPMGEVQVANGDQVQMPLRNLEELELTEITLQSAEAKRAMVARLTMIGGTSLEVKVRRMLSFTLGNELASSLNWAGKKNKDPSKQKRPFRDTALCQSMFEEQAVNLLTILPALFPSNVAVPKKMTSASEALIHVLLLSTIPFLSGFRQVTWNFSEKSHGKGAPDGVCGAVKRTADSAVQRGEDVQTPEDFYNLLTEKKSDVKFFWVTEEDIRRFDEAVPEVVPPVKGTLAMHQVISTEPGKVMHREISCFCSRPHICQCHNPIMVNLQTASVQTSAHSSAHEFAHESTSARESSDLNGKFIMVNYEGQPFVGQVLQIVGEEIGVSCMQQLGGKNAFTWPERADIIFFYAAEVLKVIAEPEPLNSRHTRLMHSDWEYFNTQN
ncbi:hypothetical protein KUCAC02_022844 [Scomber scombrus]|uniref:DUF4806 domain-containing protein n=1 Tax=Scomber scombrus TaxID=13677 RepID=A0AAV1P5T7_SCOSC